MVPPSTILIRRAEVGDAEALARLWFETGEHLVELNPHAFKLPEVIGLVEWFAQDITKSSREQDTATFVAELDGKVVGTVYVRIIPPIESAPQQVLRDMSLTRAEIDALAVARRCRRQGIGRRLMDQAEEWGRKKGATLFFLDTYVASPLSVPFYEELGYARRSIRFVKPRMFGTPVPPT